MLIYLGIRYELASGTEKARTHVCKDILDRVLVKRLDLAAKAFCCLELLGSRVMRDDGDGDVFLAFTTTYDFRRMPGAEVCCAGEMEAGEGFQNTRLAGTLVACDDNLPRISCEPEEEDSCETIPSGLLPEEVISAPKRRALSACQSCRADGDRRALLCGF